MGVFPNTGDQDLSGKGLPHARGGVSAAHTFGVYRAESSPRSWGCFQESTLIQYFSEVFPTLVGVFLHKLREYQETAGLPHARGGVSIVDALLTTSLTVFPTLVGVFPQSP